MAKVHMSRNHVENRGLLEFRVPTGKEQIEDICRRVVNLNYPDEGL